MGFARHLLCILPRLLPMPIFGSAILFFSGVMSREIAPRSTVPRNHRSCALRRFAALWLETLGRWVLYVVDGSEDGTRIRLNAGPRPVSGKEKPCV